tara:strand:+ start:332 stop:562 length:231 start_codon:yes stop_codon:yes gene_type:complete
MTSLPVLIKKINDIQMRQTVMFKGMQELKKDLNVLKVRVNSIIDETNEVASISDIVSKINILENKLLTKEINIELS